MKYHFVRCMKSNPPEFNCELCEKRFQCRTGLVWHLKKTHKVSIGREEFGEGERGGKGRRGERESEIKSMCLNMRKTLMYAYGMSVV